MYPESPRLKRRVCCLSHAEIWTTAFATCFPRLASKAWDIYAQLNGYQDQECLLAWFAEPAGENTDADPNDFNTSPFHSSFLSSDTAYLMNHHRLTSYAADLFLSIFPVGIEGLTASPKPFNESLAYLPDDLNQCPGLSYVQGNQIRRHAADPFIEDFLSPSLTVQLMKRSGFDYAPLPDLGNLEAFMMHIGNLSDSELGEVEVLVSPKMILHEQWIADGNFTKALVDMDCCDDEDLRLILNPRPMQYKTKFDDRFTCPGFFQCGLELWPMLLPNKAMPLHDVLVESRIFQQAPPELFADNEFVCFDMIRRQIIEQSYDEVPRVRDHDYVELANGWLAPKEY